MFIIQPEWQSSKECMCRLQNIAMRDYQESVTTGRQTDTRTDRRQTKGSLRAAMLRWQHNNDALVKNDAL